MNAAAVAQALAARLGGDWTLRPLHASGFCDTWRADGRERLFVKTLPAPRDEVLAAEADGLRALAAMRAIGVPAVRDQWTDEAHRLSLLALPWLELRTPGVSFGERLGHALAALHCAPSGAGFGWHRDNFIGATPQRNAWQREWTAFFAQHRLGAMQQRLRTQGAGAPLLRSVDAVVEALPRFFDDGHAPRPSLIHGDLWPGNWGMLADGTPVVYDPAVSCADAEAELAMMELFGAPPSGFWPAYREAAGLHAGYARRRGLYQLYHLLNHALLFGGGYVPQAEALARRLAAA
jgi:fructosamine-3-kinase